MHEFKTRVNARFNCLKYRKGKKAFVKHSEMTWLFRVTCCRWSAKSRFHDFDLGNEARGDKPIDPCDDLLLKKKKKKSNK